MLIPNGARIVVLRDKAAEEKNGLLLPDAAKEQPNEGDVKYAGEDSVFSVGAHVVFGRYAGVAFNHEGTEYVILDDSQVMVTVQK